MSDWVTIAYVGLSIFFLAGISISAFVAIKSLIQSDNAKVATR